MQGSEQQTDGGYLEYPPCKALTPYVACYWTRTPSARISRRPHLVLPDGCQDIVVRVTPTNIHCAWVGTMRGPFEVVQSERYEFLAVRFLPGGASALFGMPARAFTDQSIPIEMALGSAWAGLGEWLAEEKEAGRRVSRLESVLLRRLGDAKAPPPRVGEALRLSLARPGSLDVASLATAVGMSERQLERVFPDWVGVGPKAFLRTVRFQALIALARSADALDWATLAIEGGYFDQAHLIRDFRHFTGMPPGEYVRSLSGMSDFSNLPSAPFSRLS